MNNVLRGILAITLGTAVIATPLIYHRYRLTTDKRLRAVEPGRFYRSGQLTANGFEDELTQLGIRTVINVQNEFPDPELRRAFLDATTVKESELCRRLGIRYVFIDADLVSKFAVPARHPKAIDQFLKIMDDPANYPVLLHCKAGLHRTGCVVGVYRMEYQHWSPAAAIEEMKEAGFGDSACTSANEYIAQYILAYTPRWAERRTAMKESRDE